MTRLFEQTSINGMALTNRFVRSATWEGLADKDGSVTPRLVDMMVELVRGEVGLIITGGASVSPEGGSGHGQLSVCEDRFLPGLKKMVEAVHGAGGKICLQIVHGGILANPEVTGLEPLCPSPRESENQPACRPMNREDIAEVITAFARAALRAKQTGFDSIQIHAGHGCLLSEFLSPAINKRADEYGGTIENRGRLLIDVVRRVREATGTKYPILVKINAEDYVENGMTKEEAVRVSRMLEKASVDAIEFSGGTMASPEALIPSRPGVLKTPEDEVYYREAAGLYKQKVSVPLMLVGGIRSYQVADELIESGTADYIALSRPLICEPGLVKRWREGDLSKAECVSDNACFGPAIEGRGLYCITMEKKRSKAAK
jgi:2,4-dienoyl-CoA reductase-like NADH-dependent reductase (Old Yellow Enzyme family)